MKKKNFDDVWHSVNIAPETSAMYHDPAVKFYEENGLLISQFAKILAKDFGDEVNVAEVDWEEIAETLLEAAKETVEDALA